MRIRPATAEDAATIAALNTEVQVIHVEALPHLFKQPSPETFSATVASQILADAANRVFFQRQGFATFDERMSMEAP